MGDRFFLCDNKILCEYDYEERMVFANLAYNSNSLAQMKSQATRATALPPPPQPPLGSMAGPGGKVRLRRRPNTYSRACVSSLFSSVPRVDIYSLQ